MATPRRSRQSSVASHRAPASLRIPSIARRTSNTQLSLVFAQGDATRSNALSETALSRQLDGDLGGKQMGLRSRRSSSATVRTTRTTSGLRSPSPSHASVMEEDEDLEQPVAGPSSHSVGHSNTSSVDAHPPSTVVTDNPSDKLPSLSPSQPSTTRQLNPKASSTWLRWTSPTPTFPRSPAAKGKGKGKQREVEVGEDLPQSTDFTSPSVKAEAQEDVPLPTAMPPPVNPSQPLPLDNPSENRNPPPTETVKPPDTLHPALAADNLTLPTPAPSKTRGWWGRSTVQPVKQESPFVKPPSHNHSPSPSTKIPDPPSMEAALDIVQTSELKPTPTIPDPRTGSPVTSSTAPTTTESGSKPDNNSIRGWRGYLGWRHEVKEPTAQSQASSASDLPPSTKAVDTTLSSEPLDGTPALPDTDMLKQIHPTIPIEAAEANTSSVTAPSVPLPPGWSTYLYSFVVPQTISSAPKQQNNPATTIEPTSPIVDRKPELDALEPDSTDQTAIPAPPPAAPATSSRAASPSGRTNRRPSAAGWLNYLAFRASQKAVTSGGNSIMTAETEGRKSSENGNEEIMDLSADPNFPTANGGPGLAPPTSNGTDGKGKEVKMRAESIKSVTPRASQNLNIRQKRLSTSSTKSGGSLTPMSSSPVGRSSLDAPRDMSVPIKPGTGSSLIPPPQAPASQPNLVIPTFTTTFDRPPRSLLPTQVSPQAVSATSKGITAATTGLAWKALGAVGSYVYGETTPKPGPESILEDASESRGRAEGRHVGADLPRRIGLGSGSPDDGWKQVKRVVVVGVHGWFPAKMLNSVIGEPTGTSVKFANMMGQAVKQFFDEKGVDDIRLTLMPLEGEGTIDHRVDKLYKAYLSNPAWINDLRRADAIFFAAHSQGCIVTTHLISRLIAQGHIRTASNAEAVARCEWAFGPVGLLPPEEPRRGRRNPALHVAGAEGGRQKVAMLAMCGVHLGPLHSISTSTVIQPYLQWFENAAARELFEFQDTTSAVSQAYQRALSMVLENEVRMVLLASLNDQVVPIYGASFSTATHPLLLRALYVDGASYSQSDFMTNLLCFAFMLRNAGIDDQRLVEHLSEATAGSLTGVGHSTPYEELACYSLAVQYLFHAGPARQPISPLEIEPFSARDVKNDFELPWIMRALVDSPEVKDIYPTELKELKEGILNWRPTTKALKEIKRRLEPMAGRQSRLRPLPNSTSTTSLNSNTNNENISTSPGINKTLTAGLRRDW